MLMCAPTPATHQSYRLSRRAAAIAVAMLTLFLSGCITPKRFYGGPPRPPTETVKLSIEPGLLMAFDGQPYFVSNPNVSMQPTLFEALPGEHTALLGGVTRHVGQFGLTTGYSGLTSPVLVRFTARLGYSYYISQTRPDFISEQEKVRLGGKLPAVCVFERGPGIRGSMIVNR